MATSIWISDLGYFSSHNMIFQYSTYAALSLENMLSIRPVSFKAMHNIPFSNYTHNQRCAVAKVGQIILFKQGTTITPEQGTQDSFRAFILDYSYACPNFNHV
ncbi:MAG TPA: hypothetical protein ENJ82_16475 [Bacteroidetes bacterium]|nr:hypothetical protein [Bacteroidota bacterium]